MFAHHIEKSQQPTTLIRRVSSARDHGGAESRYVGMELVSNIQSKSVPGPPFGRMNPIEVVTSILQISRTNKQIVQRYV